MNKIIISSIIFGVLGFGIGLGFGIDQTMDKCIELGLKVVDISIKDKDIIKDIIIRYGGRE